MSDFYVQSSPVIVLIALFWLIKSRHKFLITHEEYKKEGEEIKRNENFQKTLKKQAKLASKNRNNTSRK